MTSEFVGAAYALGAALSWALAVNLFKKGAVQVSPVALNLFKSSLALMCFLPIVLWRDDELNGSELTYLLLSGFLGICIADTLFFWALRRITASQLALADCLFSPWVILLSFFLLEEQLELTDGLGGLLVVGSLLLSIPRSGQRSRLTQDTLPSAWGLVIAAVSIGLMGLSIVLVKPILEEHTVSKTTFVRLAVSVRVVAA